MDGGLHLVDSNRLDLQDKILKNISLPGNQLEEQVDTEQADKGKANDKEQQFGHVELDNFGLTLTSKDICKLKSSKGAISQLSYSRIHAGLGNGMLKEHHLDQNTITLTREAKNITLEAMEVVSKMEDNQKFGKGKTI